MCFGLSPFGGTGRGLWYSFDAWGRRRSANDWNYTLDANDQPLFAGRGFTGHEFLSDFNLYNMNGRLYDPVVGRFLSPDPVITDPSFTQSYNRYSYCLNNPLKFTDPSGYSWWSDFWDWAGNRVRNLGNWMTRNNIQVQAGVNISGSGTVPFAKAGSPNFNIDTRNFVKQPTAGIQSINRQIAGFSGMGWEPTGFEDVINQQFVGTSPLANEIAESPGWISNVITKTLPVAYSIETTGSTEAIGASSMSPWGGILIIRGPDKWNYKNFTSMGMGGGWVSASATGAINTYYYSGNVKNFKMEIFEGWGNNLTLSVDVGFAVGMNISWVEHPKFKGEYLIGVGIGGGVGIGPTAVSGQYTRQYNHIYW